MLVGTYVENIRSVSIKDSSYRVVMLAWFRWNGADDLDMAHNFRFYKGTINSSEVVKDTVTDGTHYQLVRVDVTFNKVFVTKLFPMGHHQLRMYLESDYTADKVIFVGDSEHSSYNSDATIAGFKIDDYDWGVLAHEYENSESDPVIDKAPVTSEYITAVTLERKGIGLYLKCFIAMYGTSIWVLISLYIAGHHRVNPLGMLPAALFGTVSNIMVGAALLPDALDLGLLEFVNIWGIATVLIGTLAVIEINNIRDEFGKQDERFAEYYGRIMFLVVTFLVVLGNFVLPFTASTLL